MCTGERGIEAYLLRRHCIRPRPKRLAGSRVECRVHVVLAERVALVVVAGEVEAIAADSDRLEVEEPVGELAVAVRFGSVSAIP